jgi:hypothetical protein
MRVTYQIGHATIGQDVKTQAEAFEFMAECLSLFTGEPCGCCGSTETFPQVQKFQGKVFRKFVCKKCTASVLLLARNDDGGLFFCRTDKEKHLLPNNGWSVYVRQGGSGGGASTRSYRSQAEDAHPRDAGGDGDGDVPF